MATQFSMLTIMNAALMSQGQEEILSLNDGSQEQRLLARNWPLIVEAELEDGNYHFTRREEVLGSRIAGKFGFDDGYTVPGDALHVRRVWLEDERGDRDEPNWTQDDAAVYLDSKTGCIAELIVSAQPDLWSANFSKGVQLRLEAVIARALKEEFGEAQQLEMQAENHFQRARTRSSQARSPKGAYRRGPIAEARFRGSR